MKMRVKDFEHYELDGETGTLRNIETGNYLPKNLSYHIDEEGNEVKDYVKIHLSNGTNKRRDLLHRIMAEAFIPNPDPEHLTQVNHINEDIHDNRVSNLEWVTPKQNTNHGTRNKRISSKNSKPIRVFKEGFSKVYHNSREASEELSINRVNLTMVANGKRKRVGGYHAEFV